MKLLILTQKIDINDPVLGFFHRWVEEFSKNFEQVTIIALGVGKYQFPNNVRVFSLGKERGASRLEYILDFYRLIWQEHKNYDRVFVHMNQVYIVLGGMFWRMTGKPIGLWYVHRAKTLSLWIAEKFANVIFTATPESFNIESKKIHFMGQAIDVEKFRRPPGIVSTTSPFKIVSVGRITSIKNLDTLIKVVKVLKDRGYEVVADLVGEAITDEDVHYEKMLHELSETLGMQKEISFVGKVSNSEIAQYYWESSLSLNLTPTGGMDKAVLESMAASTPALVSNEAFRDYFSEHADELIFKLQNEFDCADKIEAYIKNEKKEELKSFLLKRVEGKSTLSALIKQIAQTLSETRNE